jgi:coenzyme F420-reducing hydrogenase alpha subunit
MRNLNVRVRHLARVEGHGNIVIDVRNGRLEECRLEIVEAPRFFEAMIKGRRYYEIAHITCRICGICSVGHTSASLRATEAAFGVTPSEQTLRLRRAILDAEFLQSHVLHLYFLAAPDFFGVGSVIPLVGSHPVIVQRALALKRLANEACAVIGGRHIHPVSLVPGGFTRLPTEGELTQLLAALDAAEPEITATVETFAGLAMPELSRPTEYLALSGTDDYTLLGGPGERLTSTLGNAFDVRDYREKVREYPVPHSTAKHVHGGSGAYMVGALARFEINAPRLHPAAREAANRLDLKARTFNPFHNNTAQVIEVVHCYEDLRMQIRAVLETGIKDERPDVIPRAGRGVGAVEVPRGLLFHEYEYDDDGRIVSANCIIPTGQNLHHIERDMEALVPRALEMGDEKKATRAFEMLVRAYDPCISCATHMLRVRFRDGERERVYGAGASDVDGRTDAPDTRDRVWHVEEAPRRPGRCPLDENEAMD